MRQYKPKCDTECAKVYVSYPCRCRYTDIKLDERERLRPGSRRPASQNERLSVLVNVGFSLYAEAFPITTRCASEGAGEVLLQTEVGIP